MLGLIFLLMGIAMFISSFTENRFHHILKQYLGDIAGEATYILLSVYLMVVGLIIMVEFYEL